MSSVHDMAKQARPTGPMWSIDAAWKRDVLAAMGKLKVSKAELARAVGVKGSAITLLFKPETIQTRLKPAIHKKLNMVPPTATPAVDRDEALTRLLRVWKDLTEEQREHVLRTGELFLAKKG